jgi:hypothetical protein
MFPDFFRGGVFFVFSKLQIIFCAFQAENNFDTYLSCLSGSGRAQWILVNFRSVVRSW